VLATVAVYPSKSVVPFSPDRALARAAGRAGLGDAIVSGSDFDAVTVGGFLDRPVYSVARGAWIRFFVHDEREADGIRRTTTADVVCAAQRLAHDRGHAVAVVLARRPRAPWVRLAHAGGVSLYRVDPAPGVVACPPGSRQ
jgi:hypothetical protein